MDRTISLDRGGAFSILSAAAASAGITTRWADNANSGSPTIQELAPATGRVGRRAGAQ